MRKAFTMIEIIFVIVILGILAAIAIPRLTGQGDESKATICASDVGNIVSEITSNYAKLGYTNFQTLTLAQLTNSKTGVQNAESGITEAGTALVVDGITYDCEGDTAVTLGFPAVSAAGDYNLTVTPNENATVPAAIRAAGLIAQNYKTTVGNTANVPLSY